MGFGPLELGELPCADRRAETETRTALIEKQHPVVAESPLEPAVASLEAGCAEAWHALEEHEVRQVSVAGLGRDDLAREDLEARAGGVRMVERQVERVIGDGHPVEPIRGQGRFLVWSGAA